MEDFNVIPENNMPENENYRDEMDELVRIFKEELSKAQ